MTDKQFKQLREIWLFLTGDKMLSEQNFKQRQLLLSLQDAWSDFKEHIMQPGVDMHGGSLPIIRGMEELIRGLSTGPEPWAKGSKTDSEVSLDGSF